MDQHATFSTTPGTLGIGRSSYSIAISADFQLVTRAAMGFAVDATLDSKRAERRNISWDRSTVRLQASRLAMTLTFCASSLSRSCAFLASGVRASTKLSNIWVRLLQEFNRSFSVPTSSETSFME